MTNLQDTMQQYIAAWNSLDFSTLQSLWDPSEDSIYYVAEEIEHPMTDLQSVVAYWEATAMIVSGLNMTTSNMQYKPLAEDIGVATYEMHMTATISGSAKPIGVDVRVSAILRRRSGEWRFIHYAEAPLGALPFVRRASQANAR